ncbi:MAG: toxin-antitoxin system YwqK family antitoxin [Bacteroidales bacterium]|jgi:antitoxin component YwqK of YwqJK toxin-antitoxin module|nr:toxin-antitoxin system YwqK family antitoxin [Bacteroidales bacterium]
MLKTKAVCSLLFVALFACNAISQNETDKMGRKQGVWTKTNKKGFKVYEGTFVDDYETGWFKYYYPNGKLKAKTFFADNGRRGTTTVFYPNGEKMAEGFYLDRKKDSLWVTYSEQGIKISEQNYKNGMKEGVWLTFNKSGKVIEETHYKNNKKNGICLERTYNGEYAYVNYEDNVRNGEYKEYTTGGDLYITGQYHNDKRIGTWNVYEENKRIIGRKIYNDDALISFEVALFSADSVMFADIETISYFYTKGKQSVVVLNDGQQINVLHSGDYILELSNGEYFLQLNEKMNFYCSSQALKGIEPAENGNYKIILTPAPSFNVITDENSKKAMESIFLLNDNK